jgi:hypothetical protein
MVSGRGITGQFVYARWHCSALGGVGLRRRLVWLVGVFAGARVGFASATGGEGLHRGHFSLPHTIASPVRPISAAQAPGVVRGGYVAFPAKEPQR